MQGGNTGRRAAEEEQAQESNDLGRAATLERDTASNVEQGLEVEHAEGGDGRQRSDPVNASNGEEAREPVNGRQRGNTAPSGDGPHGGRMGNQLHIVAAVEEQGSVGQESIAGKPVRSRWKRGEPHGREQGATNLHGRRGENRRSGEKPQGRNEVGAWQQRPEGEAVATPTSREWTPRSSTTEGRIFGKPQERNSGVVDIGTLGPKGVGREARKVKRVDLIRYLRV